MHTASALDAHQSAASQLAGEPVATQSTDEFFSILEASARAGQSPDRRAALRILTDTTLDTARLLAIAAIPREQRFGRKIQLHVLNNVRNGYCPEDCGYCAQRNSDVAGPIPKYATKSDEEILEEARVAYESGAYRYCMVTAGRGPNERSVERFASLIRTIKEKYPLRLCLSAGILTDPALARELAEAGLDRYNHNLNTSAEHYDEICTTHDYADRVRTLDTMRGAGVSLCSGVIVGMGEGPADVVAVAHDLRAREVPSIPVNFFLPVPGHGIKNVSALNTDYCLRVLAMFRLVNPTAEIRLAAGRELHFGESQGIALQAANSVFVSGYLNVKGSDAAETIRMIHDHGYEVDTSGSDLPAQLAELLRQMPERAPAPGGALHMKDLPELRPFQK